MRPKVLSSINKYIGISKNQSLTVGFYNEGRLYAFSNSPDPEGLLYDIGSISKTVTAHLILNLAEQGMLALKSSISEYLSVPKGNYPTVYELLTHTAGYGYLTPREIVIPSLLKHGYAKRNIYQGCTADTVLNCLIRRKKRRKITHGYSYSDFSFSVLAVVAESVTGKRFSELIEAFLQDELGMKGTHVATAAETRNPLPAYGSRTVDFWKWERDNPYVAGGGLVSNLPDMLTYIKHEIESEKEYITAAHKTCDGSVSAKTNHVSCIGWHTYKKSNILWHVGAAGTFRTSVVLNRKRRLGVVVFGNSKGVTSANVHYIAKMLYNEMKIKKINFKSAEKFTSSY